MKNFLKTTLVALAMSLSVSAFAGQYVDTSGLTKEQNAELTLQVEKLKAGTATPVAQVTNVSETMRKEASMWGELGGNVGKALVGAAKEVGVAANDFASTPLGKVVTAIVVYKLIGMAMVKLIVGSGILLFGGSIVTYLMFTRFGEVKYEVKPYLFGLWNRKVVVERNEDDDALVGRMVSMAVMIFVTLLVGLKVMF